MNGVVLGTGVGFEILVVVALHAENGLYAQYSVHVGILTASLLTASPTGITEDINVRAPKGKLGITRVIDDTHGHIEELCVVVVGAVPVGASLIAYG